MAFSSDRAFNGNYDIWVAEVETGNLTQWTSSASDEFEPAWSPDGKAVAYSQFAGRKTRLMLSGKAEPIAAAEDVFPFPARWISPSQILYTGKGKILRTTIGGQTKAIPFQAMFTLSRAAYKHRQLNFDSTAPRPVKGVINPQLSPA